MTSRPRSISETGDSAMPLNILFICVGNAARSQIAEGLARKILGPAVNVMSAGSMPAGFVSRHALAVLREAGVDTAGHYSKGITDLPHEFLKNLDYVMTLCAEEQCPVFATRAKRLNWGLPDPVSAAGTENEIMDTFRATRDAIAAKLEEFKPQAAGSRPA